jgi:putative transcriptional regulator
MKKQMFEELLGSVREAGAILRGRKKPSRRVVVRSSGVRVIRERTSLSQSEFADLIGVSIKTLQNWEQERRRPTGPAAALLRVIEHNPALAVKAIHRMPDREKFLRKLPLVHTDSSRILEKDRVL